MQKRPGLKTPTQRTRPNPEPKDSAVLVDLLFGEVDLEELFAADALDEVTQLSTASANGWVHH